MQMTPSECLHIKSSVHKHAHSAGDPPPPALPVRVVEGAHRLPEEVLDGLNRSPLELLPHLREEGLQWVESEGVTRKQDHAPAPLDNYLADHVGSAVGHGSNHEQFLGLLEPCTFQQLTQGLAIKLGRVVAKLGVPVAVSPTVHDCQHHHAPADQFFLSEDHLCVSPAPPRLLVEVLADQHLVVVEHSTALLLQLPQSQCVLVSLLFELLTVAVAPRPAHPLFLVAVSLQKAKDDRALDPCVHGGVHLFDDLGHLSLGQEGVFFYDFLKHFHPALTLGFVDFPSRLFLFDGQVAKVLSPLLGQNLLVLVSKLFHDL